MGDVYGQMLRPIHWCSITDPIRIILTLLADAERKIVARRKEKNDGRRRDEGRMGRGVEE